MKLLFDENLSRKLIDRIEDLRGCDYPTSVAERLIRGQSIRIDAFFEDPERAVLVLVP